MTPSNVFLGTVAIEPNRWATVDPSWNPTIRVSEWLDRIQAAGFDGIELWERHFADVDGAERAAIRSHALPVSVFNSYVSFDEPEPDEREKAAANALELHSEGIKYNVGNDPDAQEDYAERLEEMLAELPANVAMLCECHSGISIAEEPAVAAAIFEAAALPNRAQAIVHLNETPDLLRARFHAYGDRITHVHVNFLLPDGAGAPLLSDIRGDVEAQVGLLAELGFNGSWTIEFAHGLLTENDNPAFILESATADLAVLRDILG